MQGQGSALFGIGMADGEDKAREAAERAIQSPLLEAQIKGAKSAIINVTGGASMSAYDASEAVDYIREASGNDIDIIFGVAINENIGDSIIVSVIATGFDLPTPELIETDAPADETTPLVAKKKVAQVGVVAEEDTDDVGFGSATTDTVVADEDDDIPKVAVVGKPNVGKSSLINKLLGEDRVIVSDIAGTTRDAIDTDIKYNGKEYVFIDTAGLRRKNKIKEEIARIIL